MARMDPEKADARDHAQAIINLELRRYSRRLKTAAEERIDEMFAEAALEGEPFDYKAAAKAGLSHASNLYSLALEA